jgi:hypothetical protein
MLYQSGLDTLIFGSRDWDADRLVVVSGYLGPNPVQRCGDLPFDVQIVFGMVAESGVAPADHDFFRRASSSGRGVDVRYSANAEVHSKLYVWTRNGTPTAGLIGSANFTWPGLNSPGRETLLDIPNDDLADALAYANGVIARSRSCLDDAMNSYVTEGPRLNATEAGGVRTDSRSSAGSLSLVSTRTGEVPDGSGINWGFAAANVNPNDAYLPLSVGMIRDLPGLIPPRAGNMNSPVELLWDDGEVMVGFLEGSQNVDGRLFPKQLASHPEKAILGKYLRRRLGVEFGRKVSMADLDRYGRKNITISQLGVSRYFLDFRSS